LAWRGFGRGGGVCGRPRLQPWYRMAQPQFWSPFQRAWATWLEPTRPGLAKPVETGSGYGDAGLVTTAEAVAYYTTPRRATRRACRLRPRSRPGRGRTFGFRGRLFRGMVGFPVAEGRFAKPVETGSGYGGGGLVTTAEAVAYYTTEAVACYTTPRRATRRACWPGPRSRPGRGRTFGLRGHVFRGMVVFPVAEARLVKPVETDSGYGGCGLVTTAEAVAYYTTSRPATRRACRVGLRSRPGRGRTFGFRGHVFRGMGRAAPGASFRGL